MKRLKHFLLPNRYLMKKRTLTGKGFEISIGRRVINGATNGIK